MKRLSATLLLAVGMLLGALPAGAATSFVQDGAGMFSAGTVSQLNNTISNFNAQTGKQIVVVTVPSLGGDTLQNAAQKTFAGQQVNGVLIFVAKDDRKDIIVPGRATAAFFPAETTRSIRQSMESQFRDGDYDGGITSAVNGVLDVFRAHLNSAPNAAPNQYNRYGYPAATRSGYVTHNSGVHISMFWWILIIVFGFLIIRSIMRAASGPRYYGGGPGAGPGGAPMGPGYGGGPGYGYGPGYYGGGGGFWSGLLGGLGGAFLGNELFGNRGGGTIVDQNSGNVVQGDQGGGWGGGGDASGWGNDAGQADMGASSSGDWSGGGFGGDSGGWGGGDSGGGFGGGDSGGGW